MAVSTSPSQERDRAKIRGATATARCWLSLALGVLATVLGGSITDVEEVGACWEALGSEFESGESFRIFLGRKGILEGWDEIGGGTLVTSVGAETTTVVVTVETAAAEVSYGFSVFISAWAWVWVGVEDSFGG